MTLLTRISVAVVIGSSWFACSAQQTDPGTATPPAAQSGTPQQTAPASTTPSVPSGTAQQPSAPAKPAAAKRPMTSEEVLKQEEKQRALGVVPMFGMTSVHDAPPLSSKQKFQLMARTMIDPFTFASAGLTAGL